MVVVGRTFLVLLPWLLGASGAQAPLLGQGIFAGEVTSEAVLVQARLTRTGVLVDGDAFVDGDARRDGDLPGWEGRVRFLVSTVPEFPPEATLRTDLLVSRPDRDHVVRHRFDGLQPGTRYHVAVELETGERLECTGTFRTLPGPDRSVPVRFHVVTGMNYDAFYAPGKSKGEDRDRGYPALPAMQALEPDFLVFTGDDVYYDKKPHAKTLADLRAKWHRQFAQPRMIDLLGRVPAFWQKDDHDHRYNDCDGTGDRFPPGDLGIAVFREQVPVVEQGDDRTPTYRTHRVSEDLQIWLLEGRDHRSPNSDPDGPAKTLWGTEQRGWLERSLLASDARFRVIISPTPLIGPDDAYKRDNHTNPKGFLTEGEAFLAWGAEHSLWGNGVFLCCGDRHWQYHTVHPSGAQEFSCGAICDANSRVGRKPGDPKSTDPEGRLKQPYTQRKASGGFLSVVVEVGEDVPKIHFDFHDERGELLHRSSP